MCALHFMPDLCFEYFGEVLVVCGSFLQVKYWVAASC
jgi:hypothetical protein